MSLGHNVICAPDMIRAKNASHSPAYEQASLRTPLIPIQAVSTPIPIPSMSLPNPALPMMPANDATPMQTHRRMRSTTLDSSKGDDYFSVKRQNSISASEDRSEVVASPGGGLMGRLKYFGKSKNARPTSELIQPSSTPAAESEDPTTPMPSKHEDKQDDKPKTALDVLLAQPFNPPPANDAPVHAFPPGLHVMISEEDGWGGWTVRYHGQPHLSFSHMGDEVDAKRRVIELEQTLPMWLLEFLLTNKIPPAPAQVKLSFVLLPWRDELPELINTYV